MRGHSCERGRGCYRGNIVEERSLQRPGRRFLTAEEIERISQAEGTVRAIAKAVGCSKSAVHYHRIRAWEASDEPDPMDAVKFTRVNPPVRCPNHGLQWLTPCVQCVAESAMYDR